MTFQHPEFLYYMLPPLFILFGLLLTQKETQELFFSQEVMDKLRASANTLTLKARNVLFMFTGIMIVVALAGPSIKDGQVEIKAKSADIMIALDISDSMLAKDVYPNRLKSAKQKALELLKIAPNERMGVIAFARNSYLVSPLSFDHNAVGFLLRQLNTNSITEKGTNLLSMLQVVDGSVKKDAKKYLLILSDGGDKKDFSEEISYAKKKGITIFVLGIGTQKGAPIQKENGSFIKKNGEIIITKLNENIANLATQTGGVYIKNVTSDKDIKTMLKEIESHSKKKELKSEKIERFIPLFYFPLGLALLLLLIATSSMGKRETVHVPSAFLLFALLLSHQNADAGILDFMELDKAKTAYEKGDYQKAQKLYTDFAVKSHNSQGYYNAGNAAYKQKKYDEAIQAYKKVRFKDNEKHAKNQANLGNAYAKKGDMKSLENAVGAYENSLKLHEDKDVRENLKIVKKELKKQKKKQKKQEQKKKKKENQKENQQNKQDKKQDKNKKQNKQNEKKSDKNKKEKNSSKKQNSQKNKQEQKKGDDKKDSKQKNESKKKDLKKLKEKDEKSKMSQSNQDKKEQMSDAEEKKWLKQLNKQQSTYMYKLNKNNKIEENLNETPW